MNCLINYPKFLLSINCLIEQVYIALISIMEDDGITRKYEKRARWLIRRLNLWNPPPQFIIYRRDLPKHILLEFLRLQKESPKTLDYFITRALEMIFSCIEEAEEQIFNNEHYLLSIKQNRTLRWRFDKPEDIKEDPDSKYDINFPIYTSRGIELRKGEIIKYD